MNNRSKSLKNLAYLLLNQVITITLGLLLPRLFIINYGSEVNGLLTSLNQLLAYLSLFEAGVGSATMQALYSPVAREEWDSINGILAATNYHYRRTGQWYFVILLILVGLYPLLVNSSLEFWTIAGAVFFSGLGSVVTFFFHGKYRFFLEADGKSYIITNLTSVIFIIVSLSKVILILLEFDIVAILAASFLINCLQSIFILRYVKRYYPKVNLSVTADFKAISHKNYALIHQICTLVFNNTDVLLLTFFCNLKVVSLYAMFKLVAYNLESILDVPINSIRFVLGQTYQTDKARYCRRVDIFESYYSAIVYALFSVALFLYLPFMALYTDGVTDINYIDGKLALMFVMISLLNRSRFPMMETAAYAGKFRETLPKAIAEAAINLTISFIGIQQWGIYGVLLGTIVALSYRTNDMLIYANHTLLERSALRTYGIYLVNIGLFVAMQNVYSHIFVVQIDSWYTFIQVGSIATVLALFAFSSAQTIVFSHCRKFIIGSLKVKRVLF